MPPLPFNMVQVIFILLLGLLPVKGVAQIRVISVDTTLGRNQEKSLSAAMAFSMVLPGSGQYYLGSNPQLVRAYLWSDAAMWAVLLVSHMAGNSYMQSAQSYAARYAGLYPPADPDFLDVMARWRSRGGVQGQKSAPEPGEDYNHDQLRAGQAVDQFWPYGSSYSWDWGSSDDPANTQAMEEFSQLLRNYRMTRISLQVAAGALVLNRIIALAHTLRIYRATSHQGFASHVQTLPILSNGQSGAQVLVSF